MQMLTFASSAILLYCVRIVLVSYMIFMFFKLIYINVLLNINNLLPIESMGSVKLWSLIIIDDNYCHFVELVVD